MSCLESDWLPCHPGGEGKRACGHGGVLPGVLCGQLDGGRPVRPAEQLPGQAGPAPGGLCHPHLQVLYKRLHAISHFQLSQQHQNVCNNALLASLTKIECHPVQVQRLAGVPQESAGRGNLLRQAVGSQLAEPDAAEGAGLRGVCIGVPLWRARTMSQAGCTVAVSGMGAHQLQMPSILVTQVAGCRVGAFLDT